MSFPYHDRCWTETAEFLTPKVSTNDKVIAPDIFWWLFGRLYKYVNTRLDPECSYDWVVIHKGELDKLSKPFLEGVAARMNPVFANEVFGVWSSRKDLESLDRNSDHLKAFLDRLPGLEDDSEVTRKARESSEKGVIQQFKHLTAAELAAAMDEFWKEGGYLYETLRDKVYCGEIDRYLKDFVGEAEGRTILDICCGSGRLSQTVTRSRQVVGIDISKVAIERAREEHRGREEFVFEVMDACTLAFPNKTFDTVLLVEAIEHVQDARKMFSEISRVIRPGGDLFLTAANTNSLHQIITRKLGYPGFVTNYQHIEEFSFQQIRELLSEAGFTISKSAGIFLYPYWAVPGIDEAVRPITDNDPEMVEVLRTLGERAGPEYAYAIIVLAKKELTPAA